MSPAERYCAAQTALIYLEAAGVVSDEVTDPIRDRLDGLWLQMADSERRLAREQAATLLRKLSSE